MQPTLLSWTESAEDRLTGEYSGNRVVARAFAVMIVLFLWACFSVLAFLVPEPVFAWLSFAVVTLAFAASSVFLLRFGGRKELRRRVARVRAELPQAAVFAATPVDGMPYATREVVKLCGDGSQRGYLLIASFVVAVEKDRITFVSGRRRMVALTDDVVRIRRGMTTTMRPSAPTLVRPTIDLIFAPSGHPEIVVQLCPVPVDSERLHRFRPAELRPIAESIDRVLTGAQ